jgi:hypothetical protein
VIRNPVKALPGHHERLSDDLIGILGTSPARVLVDRLVVLVEQPFEATLPILVRLHALVMSRHNGIVTSVAGIQAYPPRRFGRDRLRKDAEEDLAWIAAGGGGLLGHVPDSPSGRLLDACYWPGLDAAAGGVVIATDVPEPVEYEIPVTEALAAVATPPSAFAAATWLPELVVS